MCRSTTYALFIIDGYASKTEGYDSLNGFNELCRVSEEKKKRGGYQSLLAMLLGYIGMINRHNRYS